MQEKSIIIVGAGMAGLSAGCYGQMNGFRTRIFEMHTIPGGLCTSWKRKGYTIDGCLEWLNGSSPASGLFRIWEELGGVKGRTMVDHEEYLRVEEGAGKTFIIYTNIDRLERHMKEIAPEDAALIDELIEGIRFFTRLDPPVDADAESDVLKFLPVARTIGKWNKISLREFGMRFKNPLLREAFVEMFVPELSLSWMLMILAYMHLKSAGYPTGGSLAFSRTIEKRYLALGGRIDYKARVTNILTDNGRAVGVRLADGSEHRADYVVSAADGYATIFGLLEGRYADDTIRNYYEKLMPYPPLIQVSFGVAMMFDDLPRSSRGINFPLSAPLKIGGTSHNRLMVQTYNFDRSLAPAGKTLMKVLIPADYDFWKRLRENNGQYQAEKERIADAVIAQLDRRFPGLAARVEMRDVATPTTFVRYTGNWKASFEGWMVTPTTMGFGKVMKRTLPGLENFYLAGHWVEPGGGVPSAALSGRKTIQIICKREKKPFAATKA